MSCFKSGKSDRNFGRNFCPNPVNPVPAGFENSKSGATPSYQKRNYDHGRQTYGGTNYETWSVFEKSAVGAKSGTEPPPIL